jgi:mono/diheme cytochrome c family protein
MLFSLKFYDLFIPIHVEIKFILKNCLYLHSKYYEMKKTIVIVLTAFAMYSCAKKMTPTITHTNASEVKVNNPPQPAAPPLAEANPVMANPTVKAKPIADPTAKIETKEVAAGKETFKAKCGRCHGLKPAEMYTAEKWVKIIDWMAPKAKLDASEKENVLAYVSFYAKA